MNIERIKELITYHNAHVVDKWVQIILRDILHHLKEQEEKKEREREQ